MRTKIGIRGAWTHCEKCGKEAKKHLLCKAEKDIFKYYVCHLCGSRECSFDFYIESKNVISEINENSWKKIIRYNYKIDLRSFADGIGYGIAKGIISKEEAYFLINKSENETIIKDILE